MLVFANTHFWKSRVTLEHLQGTKLREQQGPNSTEPGIDMGHPDKCLKEKGTCRFALPSSIPRASAHCPGSFHCWNQMCKGRGTPKRQTQSTHRWKPVYLHLWSIPVSSSALPNKEQVSFGLWECTFHHHLCTQSRGTLAAVMGIRLVPLSSRQGTGLALSEQKFSKHSWWCFMVKCRRRHFLFLYDEPGILTLWILYWPITVASSVCWNPPWCVKKAGVCLICVQLNTMERIRS